MITSFSFVNFWCNSETRQQTLEEIAAAFGDEVINADNAKSGGSLFPAKAGDAAQNTAATDHHEIR